VQQGLSQQNMILLLVDGVGTKAGQMGIHDLGVEEEKLAIAQSFHQAYHSHLRAIRDAEKHRFADESPTNNQAQDAASQAIALPGFKAIGPPSLIKGLVDVLELRRDPGRFSVGTTGNYPIKVPVNSYAEAFLVEHSPEGLGIAKPIV